MGIGCRHRIYFCGYDFAEGIVFKALPHDDRHIVAGSIVIGIMLARTVGEMCLGKSEVRRLLIHKIHRPSPGQGRKTHDSEELLPVRG